MDKHSRQKLLIAIALSFSCLSLSVLPSGRGWAQSAEVSSLIQQLKDKDKEVRYSAVFALGNIGAEAKAAIPALIQALQQDKDKDVRSSAAFALGRMGAEAKAAVPDLIQALQQDKDKDLRFNAAIALGSMGVEAKAAVPDLIQALQQDKDKEVRSSAANALGSMGAEAKAAVPDLIQALQQDKDKNLRFNAASALGSIGAEAKAAVPDLIQALQQDKDKEVRSSAANALGAIGVEAKAAIPALIQALQQDKDQYLHSGAAFALGSFAESFQDKVDTLSFGELEKAISDLEKSLKAIEDIKDESLNDATARVKRSLDALKLKKQARIFDQTLIWIQKNPWSVAIVIVPVLYLGVLGLRPQWLLLLPAEFTIPKTGIKLTPQILLVLKYRPRVLDAWVAAHIDSARKGFQKKTTVSDRAIYIPIPVVLDGNNVANLSVKDLQPTFADKRSCLLICGEGGAGKTSLACQLAEWAMSDDAERLCKHRMLPVLIEQELNFEVAAGKKAFTEMIRGQFQALIGKADAIPDELLDRLLRQRRILVIVDHLSEVSAATRKEIQPGHPDFPANALIVTSRLEEKLDDVPKTVIKPLRIEGNRLSSFMEAYLTQRGKRDLFTDPEFFNACSRLSLMVGQRNITVLLAKLYAEQMISAKEGATATDLPDNIPDLMLSYLNELNRDAADNEPNNRTVQRDAKAIAWECLKQTYHPSAAKRDDVVTVLAALNGNDNAEARLQYLEKRLRLIQTISSAQDKIRFALDPLAEYLAGLHIVELYSNNGTKWREFLVQADIKPNLEAIKGFLLAVRDCCLAKDTEAKVPDFVVEELGKHAGLVTKVEQTQLAQSLVNDKTILLTRKE